ncbi:MAG TPA: family 78 glycoside hydrolase catalytic domain [Clostridiales bacterium]|nr:family 78 glycoside hydrolase catalytic domain [Clostridiales bacterium]
MKIRRMKCNRITKPLGFNLGRPRLSWVTEAPGAKFQKAAQIQVAEDERFHNIIFDSGRSSEIDSLGFELPIELKPRTRYYWRVTVWTENDQKIESSVEWFETSKMDEPWTAEWITPDWEDKKIHPLLRKSFSLDGEIASARAYVCGLGLYELEINGRKAGEEYLTPYCNAYDKWIQYQTYDVTDLLKPGLNAIGAMLGEGWYMGRFGFGENQGNIYGDTMAFICELIVTYKDGRTVTIATDDTWKAAAGPIISSSIYDGEVFDANRQIPGWSQPDFNDSSWSGTRLIDIGYDRLQARRSLPVNIMDELKPREVIITPKGEKVLDMGQNMVGWVRFKVNAPKGSEIVLYHGEALQDGCFSRENLRSAKAEYHYISDGKPAEVRPHFTFYGFRYVKVEGWNGEVNPDDFTGCVLHSNMERTGWIETSNPLVNRLFLNAFWGQKGNFLDVPTDCPQRDERMGWTGDANVFSGTACFNMDADAFYHKYLYDLALEQKEENGRVPHVVPKTSLTGEPGVHPHGGSSAWGDAATVIPWNVYLHYGDKAILEQQLESMKAWVDWIRSKDDGSRLWNTGFHFGDWLALDGPGGYNPFGGTPTDLIATAFYAYSARLVAKAAKMLGKEDIAREYQTLADEVKKAFQNEFLTPRGRLAADNQTAYVLALFMDLVPDIFRKRLADTLNKRLEENEYHLKTGFVGTPYLCRVLSENGYNDTAYRLLLNEDYPGWLYEVKMGATTVWERWNSLLPDGKFGELGMNSLNHYAYGSIVEWMYRNMCGINPVEDCPGFRKVRLAPQPNKRLQWAKAVLDSAAGRFESSWKIEENMLCYTFVIPFDTTAEVFLPDAVVGEVMINGRLLANSGFDALQEIDGVEVTLTAGEYKVEYPAYNV